MQARVVMQEKLEKVVTLVRAGTQEKLEKAATLGKVVRKDEIKIFLMRYALNLETI
jgi:hypothetical protein